MMHHRLVAMGATLLIAVGATAALAQGPSDRAIVVTSPTLRQGEPVPRAHTPDGRNISPALAWTGLPEGTKELAVLCEDPGAGNPPPFVHWLIYGIPPSAPGLPEALPIDSAVPLPREIAGAVQGMSGFRRAIYRGPAPPPGRAHDYHFVVLALDRALGLGPGLDRAAFLRAAEGHVIGRGELVATYQRGAASP